MSRSFSENEGGEINLLFLNGSVITPLFPETNRGSPFHPLVIGPIRSALPHRDKRGAAFGTGGRIREVEGGPWRVTYGGKHGKQKT